MAHDLNADRERSRARKLARRQVQDFLANLSVTDRYDLLMDVLDDVQEDIDRNLPTDGSKEQLPVSAPNNRMSTTGKDEAKIDESELGTRPLIIRVLRECAPQRLKSTLVVEAVRKKNPDITAKQIYQALNGMTEAKDPIILRVGKAGEYRYGIDPNAGDHNDDPTQVDQLLAQLKVIGPTNDFAALAIKVYGEDNAESRHKVRGNLYYLRKGESPRVRQRKDGTWEVTRQND